MVLFSTRSKISLGNISRHKIWSVDSFRLFSILFHSDLPSMTPSFAIPAVRIFFCILLIAPHFKRLSILLVSFSARFAHLCVILERNAPIFEKNFPIFLQIDIFWSKKTFLFIIFFLSSVRACQVHGAIYSFLRCFPHHRSGFSSSRRVVHFPSFPNSLSHRFPLYRPHKSQHVYSACFPLPTSNTNRSTLLQVVLTHRKKKKTMQTPF